MCRKLNLLLFCFAALFSGAQIPDTDLWLFKIESSKTKQKSLKEPVNITNRAGYDNQAAFSPDGKKIYYTSIREDKQADIYYYDIRSKKTMPLTKSRTSEYSPTPVSDGRLLASVVVEADSAQRIHFINAETGTDEKRLETDSIGYFSYLNADTIVYYKLGHPHSLRYTVPATGEDRWLANAPIRTFRAKDRHTLIYGLKDSTEVRIYNYDFLLQKAVVYATCSPLNEDIVWHAELGLLRSEEHKLLRFDEVMQQWILLFDLSAFGIKKITRFSIDPKSNLLVLTSHL